MTSTQDEPTYEFRMYGIEGPPAAMWPARRAGMDALGAIEGYRESGDELGALGLWFWLRNQAEMRLMMSIGRQLGVGTSWSQIAQTLGMDESEARERWGDISSVPTNP